MSKDDQDVDFSAISLDLLRRYLLLHGWQRETGSESASRKPLHLKHAPPFMLERQAKHFPELFILHAEQNTPVEVVLPKSPDSSGYTSQLKEVMYTIAEVSGASISQMLLAVHAIGFDIIRNSIPITASDRGTIPLELAQSYILNAKNLLSAAATNEIEPSPYFERTKKEGKLFSDHCRFGHTFAGSFGFTIESALPAPIHPMENVQLAPPFERRVFRRLANSFQAVFEAVEKDDLSPLVDQSVSGLSANGCEIVASLIQATPSSNLRFEVLFSPVWKELEITNQKFEVTLTQVHVEAYKAAAKKMRAPEVSEPSEISGLITDLSTNANPLDLEDTRSNRSIVVLWSSEKHGDIRVYANVSAKQYLDALSAHRDGRPIRLSGLLSKTGRRWTLNQRQIRVNFELFS